MRQTLRKWCANFFLTFYEVLLWPVFSSFVLLSWETSVCPPLTTWENTLFCLVFRKKKTLLFDTASVLLLDVTLPQKRVCRLIWWCWTRKTWSSRPQSPEFTYGHVRVSDFHRKQWQHPGDPTWPVICQQTRNSSESGAPPSLTFAFLLVSLFLHRSLSRCACQRVCFSSICTFVRLLLLLLYTL
jgi:hypothetical protein